MERPKQGKGKLRGLIIAVSIAVPVLVAILFFTPQKLTLGNWVYILPHFHAVLNSLTSVILVAALLAIKAKNIELHKNLMISAVVMGGLFLLSYVTYHSSADSVIYGDTNGDGLLTEAEKNMSDQRGLYLGVLLSHIGLSIFALPLVLIALYRAVNNQIERHRKIVRFAYPIWLYVSITGVIVYFMIRPYYL